jgi:hypothetical protein
MRAVTFSTNVISELFATQSIATMHELKKALGTSVDMTVFRKLNSLGYLASYSHRGKFYTLSIIPEFNEKGIWIFNNVYFSQCGTLRNTVHKFVSESQAGYSAAELRNDLHVEVKATLLNLTRCNELCRELINGTYIYVSTVPAIRRQQIMARHDQQSASLDNLTNENAPILSHHLRAAIILFVSLLDERQRRLWAGLESMRIGHGGDTAIAQLLKIAPQTVARGRRELLDQDVEIERVRREGGGRPAIKKNS